MDGQDHLSYTLQYIYVILQYTEMFFNDAISK